MFLSIKKQPVKFLIVYEIYSTQSYKVRSKILFNVNRTVQIEPAGNLNKSINYKINAGAVNDSYIDFMHNNAI